MKRARGGGPTPLAEVLEGVLSKAGVRDQVRRMSVLELWPDIVGDGIAKVSRARAVVGATLFVEVRSSAWLMELNMMKGDILERVNRRFQDVPMDRIVFKMAETDHTAHPPFRSPF